MEEVCDVCFLDVREGEGYDVNLSSKLQEPVGRLASALRPGVVSVVADIDLLAGEQWIPSGLPLLRPGGMRHGIEALVSSHDGIEFTLREDDLIAFQSVREEQVSAAVSANADHLVLLVPGVEAILPNVNQGAVGVINGDRITLLRRNVSDVELRNCIQREAPSVYESLKSRLVRHEFIAPPLNLRRGGEGLGLDSLFASARGFLFPNGLLDVCP